MAAHHRLWVFGGAGLVVLLVYIVVVAQRQANYRTLERVRALLVVSEAVIYYLDQAETSPRGIQDLYDGGFLVVDESGNWVNTDPPSWSGVPADIVCEVEVSCPDRAQYEMIEGHVVHKETGHEPLLVRIARVGADDLARINRRVARQWWDVGDAKP